MKGQKNQAISIYNILRKIGLSPKTKGIKLLTSAIIIALNSSNEFLVVSDIYNILSKKYSLAPQTIKTNISYALHNPIGKDYKENFQDIFGIKFCEDLYTSQTIIEEVIRIIY